MKMKIVVVLIALMTSLIGCHHGEKNGESPKLLGQWITDTCAQGNDDENSSIGQWARGVYAFHVSGMITISLRFFEDSSCSGSFTLIESESSLDSSLTYEDHGTVTLEEGIEGGEIAVNFRFEEKDIIVEGFYSINSASLCFSDNLNFEPYIVSTSEAEYTTIDFEKCLSKVI